jgi:nucleotide-binding universal stress UspA family protein
MNTAMPSSGDLYLVVGYDGSAPAVRALDAAAALLRGRDGSIDVVYVPHLPAVDMLSADAVAGMETTFDEIARDCRSRPASSCAAVRSAGGSSVARTCLPTSPAC